MHLLTSIFAGRRRFVVDVILVELVPHILDRRQLVQAEVLIPGNGVERGGEGERLRVGLEMEMSFLLGVISIIALGVIIIRFLVTTGTAASKIAFTL